jgi:Lrp/AsnC family transcriptional regulator
MSPAMDRPRLDAIDCRLMALLQADATLSLAQLAEAVGLSTTPCWRRLQRLREDGVILGQVALLSPEKVNVAVTVFVTVRTADHTPEWFARFRATCEAIPEIVEFYRLSGEVDYLLRIVVPDIKAYDSVYKRLTDGTQLRDVSASFAMERIKHTTALPLGYACPPAARGPRLRPGP